MADRSFEDEKIDVYLAIKKLVNDKRPVTMYGISRLTSLTPSYLWRAFGLNGDILKMIDDVEKEV